MDAKTRKKIIALQQPDLDLRERAKLILELEEFLLREGHIGPRFKDLVFNLRELLKNGNGKLASVTERVINEITEDLKDYLEKHEAKK
jgi:hypothetical protein